MTANESKVTSLMTFNEELLEGLARKVGLVVNSSLHNIILTNQSGSEMRRIKTPDSNKILAVNGRYMKVPFSKWKNLVGLVESTSKTYRARKTSIISSIVMEDMELVSTRDTGTGVKLCSRRSVVHMQGRWLDRR